MLLAIIFPCPQWQLGQFRMGECREGSPIWKLTPFLRPSQERKWRRTVWRGRFTLFFLCVFIHGMGHFIRHLVNENRTGAEMCPANVSGITTWDARISYWSICFFVSNFSPSSLKWRLKGSNGGTAVRIYRLLPLWPGCARISEATLYVGLVCC